ARRGGIRRRRRAVVARGGGLHWRTRVPRRRPRRACARSADRALPRGARGRCRRRDVAMPFTRVLATLVYAIRDDEVLLHQRVKDPNRGLWVAPGGKLE